MAIGVQVWSKTPASNANSDSNINFAEGQAPSSLNDSCRAALASVASWRDDNNGTLVTSGTTLAATLVTNQVEGALTAGYTVGARLANTLDVGATLAVDGLAAAPIQIVAGQNIAYNILQAGSIQKFTYSSTGTGQWIVNGGVAPAVTSTSTSPLLTYITKSTTASIVISSAAYTDGPSVSQGSSGTWFVTASITLANNSASAIASCKLWDGTTVIDSGTAGIPSAGYGTTVPLSGVIASPAGNLKVSAMGIITSNTLIESNFSGNLNDSTITAVRIG